MGIIDRIEALKKRHDNATHAPGPNSNGAIANEAADLLFSLLPLLREAEEFAAYTTESFEYISAPIGDKARALLARLRAEKGATT